MKFEKKLIQSVFDPIKVNIFMECLPSVHIADILQMEYIITG